MNNKISKIIIVLCCLTSTAHAKKDMFGFGNNDNSVSSSDMEKVLVNMTRTMNKDLPRDISAYKQLKTTTAGPGLQFTYTFILIKNTSGDTGKKDIANYLHQEEQSVKSSFCSNPKTIFFVKNGVTANYEYYLSDGIYMGDFNVTPKDCGY
jgi:hypothetical protein